jgi:hypothetical protein
MNKGRRNELTRLKFQRRLKLYGVKEGEGNFFGFQSHGKPCSCYLCRNEKFNRAKDKINILNIEVN